MLRLRTAAGAAANRAMARSVPLSTSSRTASVCRARRARRAFDQRLHSRGELDLPGRADELGRTEVVLEAAHDPAEVGLGKVQPLGGPSDVTQLIPLVDAVPPIRGRPRRQPRVLLPTAATTTTTVACSACAGSLRELPARRRARFRPWQVPLGRRAPIRLAACLQAAAHPLGAPRRHPPRPTPTRLRPDLPRQLDAVMKRLSAEQLVGGPRRRAHRQGTGRLDPERCSTGFTPARADSQ